MKIVHFCVTLLLMPLTNVLASGMDDDPLLFKLMIDRLEGRDIGNHAAPLFWDGSAWLGKDLNKLWLKTEGERINGVTTDAELQLLYSRAIDPFWDVQIGWRHDFAPQPKQDWLAIGLQGTAPWFIGTDLTLFVGDKGRSSLRLNLEYEQMLSQRWVLTPELEVNFHGKADQAREQGSGLSDTSLGLRLSYEIRREIAPYAGINWNKLYGGTADHARQAGEHTDELHWVAGIRLWF
jgi:copper resistance protein B